MLILSQEGSPDILAKTSHQKDMQYKKTIFIFVNNHTTYNCSFTSVDLCLVRMEVHGGALLLVVRDPPQLALSGGAFGPQTASETFRETCELNKLLTIYSEYHIFL